MTKNEIITKACHIMAETIPNFNANMFMEHLEFSSKGNHLEKVCLISIEDINMCEEGLVDEYPASFHTESDYTLAWEDNYLGCGMKMDELDECRDGYLGIIDLNKGIYVRANGHADAHTYGDSTSGVEDPSWNLWTK
jgi:hypothetical protein